jgi:hypothetical protein
MGEYDILNDLVYDGARRLRDNAGATDLELLRQNDPCLPPDRWVRPTGWGRCNPSSTYVKDPPADFNWFRYYDKLQLKTGPHARDGAADGGGGGDPTRLREFVGGRSSAGVSAADDDNVASAEPRDMLSRATGDTQNTNSTAPIAVSSRDLSWDEHHRVNGRLTMVCRAGSGAAMPIKSSASASGGVGGGAPLHINWPRAAPWAAWDAAPR